MEKPRHILLLDGNDQSANEIQRFLKAGEHELAVSRVSDVSESLTYLKSRKPDLILLDSNISSQNNFTAFKRAKENIPVILLSNLNEHEAKQQAEIAGAEDYLVKNKINLLHLQKSIFSVLKQNENESKSNTVQIELNTHHESLYQLINKINSGVLVLNKQNTIRYANAKAYSILSDNALEKYLSQNISYRNADEEETIVFKAKNNLALNIRVSNIEWKGEEANLFLLDRIKLEEENAYSFLSNETLKSFLNSIHENVLLLKGDNILLANAPALDKMKLKKSDVFNLPLKNIFEIKETLPGEMNIQTFLAEKEMEAVLKFSDNSALPVKLLIKPLNLLDEYYQLLSFSFKEEIANIPKARNDEETFSGGGILHLASHDLREPVRTILNYVQLISENLDNKKYDVANEYAHFAKNAADGMDKLLSDLKTFVSLNDYAFRVSKTPMKAVLADVLRQLKPKIEKAEAEISFAELPEVNADRTLVEKLLLQLIDNALKFARKDKKPVIDIGCDKFEGNVIFCVRDNGIGISKKYFPKIFEPFERLNRMDEFAGSGLGLAISKKIVEMHGGELWVESLPGSGSNFYFTLSVKKS